MHSAKRLVSKCFPALRKQTTTFSKGPSCIAIAPPTEANVQFDFPLGSPSSALPEEITDLEQELSLNTGAVAHWQHILTIAPEEI